MVLQDWQVSVHCLAFAFAKHPGFGRLDAGGAGGAGGAGDIPLVVED